MKFCTAIEYERPKLNLYIYDERQIQNGRLAAISISQKYGVSSHE
jgi:hypothetical protein